MLNFNKIAIFSTTWLLLVVILVTPSSIKASSDLGVRAQSLGGAFRAVASANDIILYNPAGILKYRRLGADFDYQIASDSGQHRLLVSLLDSKTTSWGLGLAYSTVFSAKTAVANSHLVYLGLAMPIIMDYLVLGTSGSYLYDDSKSDGQHKNFFNMDVGLLAQMPAGISFSVTADHILQAKGQEKPTGVSLAAAFDLGQIVKDVPLTTSFDWSMDDVRSADNLDHVISGGLEYLAYSVLPLRLGIKSELKEHNHFLSMGTGFFSQIINLDLLYQQHLGMGRIRHFGAALRLNI